MATLRTVQSSFTAGVLDPRLFGRIDIKHYYAGAKTLKNVNIYQEGGIYRRPGTRYLDTLTQYPRLAPFVFNDEQHYLIVLTKGKKIHIYKDGAEVLELDSVDGVTWEDSELQDVTWAQEADTMLLFHFNNPTLELKRVGPTDADWTLTEVTWGYIPKFAFSPTVATPAGTMTPSAVSGKINITSSSSVFLSTDVGGYIQGNGGEARITKFVGTGTVQAQVTFEFINTNAVASGSWSIERGYEDAWSVTRGYPRCGVFTGDALHIGGSLSLPQTWWRSRVGEPFNFDLNASLDDDAIERNIDADSAEIRFMMSADHLLFFASAGEHYVKDRPVVPTSEPLKQDRRGIARVPPVFIDGAAFFAQNDADVIREFRFDADFTNKYTAKDVSLLAHNLINTPVAMAHLPAKGTRTEDLVYVANSDGSWTTLNTLRDQEITAWVEGEFVDGLAVSFMNDYNEMYAAIQYGADYHIVRFDSSYFLDDSIKLTNATPQTTWTGLGHLEGETVYVIADGIPLEVDFVVASGGIELALAASNIEVGRSFNPLAELLPVERELPDGPMYGRKRRINKITLDLLDTFGIFVNGSPIVTRNFGQDVFTVGVPYFTGIKEIPLLGYSRSPTVTIEQRIPSNMNIRSVISHIADLI